MVINAENENKKQYILPIAKRIFFNPVIQTWREVDKEQLAKELEETRKKTLRKDLSALPRKKYTP